MFLLQRKKEEEEEEKERLEQPPNESQTLQQSKLGLLSTDVRANITLTCSSHVLYAYMHRISS